MHIFKYMYLNTYIYSNICKLVYIYISIFKPFLFGNHNLSGPSPSSRDIPITMQLVVEPLMKAMVTPLIGNRHLKLNNSWIANLETFPMIV